MVNLDEFNKGLDALWANPTEEAKAKLKNLLASLTPEQRKKAEEEIKRRNLWDILPVDHQESLLFSSTETKETRADTYSLEAVEDRIHSRLFKFALNRWNVGELIQAKVEWIIDKSVFEKSKSTIQVVYMDKIVSECKPWHLIYNQMMKLWGKAKSLFWGIFKPDGSFDLEWALKVGDAIPDGEEPSWESQKKKPGVVETVRGAHELDSETKGIIATILSDAMEKYNENLKLLNTYAKDKPGFKELFDNPLVLSKVLEEGKYEADGIKINIVTKEFTYISPSWLESTQDTFVNQLVEKANSSGWEIDKILSHRKTFDKILWFLELGSLKDFIVSILEMFGIWGLAGKWVDLLEKMMDGKTDKEAYLDNFKNFLDSPTGKTLVSWRTDFSHKELKNFYKILKKVNFGKEFPDGMEDKNLWAYLLTWKDSEGKGMPNVNTNGEVELLRKVVADDIVAKQTPIDSKDLVKWLNSLSSNWVSIKRKQIEDTTIQQKQEGEKKRTEWLINTEKTKLNTLVSEVKSFVDMNTSTLTPDKKSKINEYILEAESTSKKDGVSVEELRGVYIKLDAAFTALKTGLPLTTPWIGVIPPVIAPQSLSHSEVPVEENPFKNFPLLTTIAGTEIRFESSKKYIILWDKAYQIEDILKDGESKKNDVDIENLSFENGKLKVVFKPTEKVTNAAKAMIASGMSKDPLYKEIADKWTITFEIDPKDFETTITAIKNNEWREGIYKNEEKKLEVKFRWVPKP